MAEYKISLGAEISQQGLGEIKRQIESLENNTIKLTLDKSLTKEIKTIKEQISNIGGSKGKNKTLIPIDTTSLENSLRDVSTVIKDIKASIGTLDSSKGMKSLLSSINQINTALDKASNQFGELNGQLKVLGSKDFNINLGINMGSGNKNSLAYGREARKYIMPQLEAQVKYLENLLGGKNAAVGKMFSAGIDMGDMDKALGGFNSKTMIEKMESYEKYIGYLKKAVGTLNPNALSDFDAQFSKSASQLIDEVTDIKQATDVAEDSAQKFKKIFGSGIDSDSLTQILNDLNEIKTSLQSLASNNSIDGLTQSFNKLSATLEKLMSNVTLVQNNLGTGLSGVGSNFDNVGSAITDVENKLRRIGDIKISFGGDDSVNQINNLKTALQNFDFNTASIDNITKDLEEMNVSVRKVTSSLNNDGSIRLTVTGVDELGRTVTAMKNVAVNAETMEYEVQDAGLKVSQSFERIVNAATKIKEKLSGSDLNLSEFNDEINGVMTRFNKLSDKSEELRAEIVNLNNAFNEIKSANASDDIERLVKANKDYEDILKRINIQLKNNERTQANSQDRINLSLQMDNWLKDNSAAAKQFGSKIRELQSELKNCDKQRFDGIKKEFREVQLTAKNTGKNVKTFGDSIKDQFKKYSSYLSVATLFMYAEQGLRSMFEQVKLIDSAMTELKKVTDETDASYNKFLTNAASRAKEIGTTIDGLVASTADFARLGYGFQDAQGLAEVANIYAVVGDEVEGVEGATESLISTMAAFKDEMNGMSNTDFAMSLIDKMNEVGNNFAISSGGIGEALKRSASSMATANNTIDETISLITAANTVVQNPEKVGNAFKTISMRLRAAKTELSEMGEDTEGMAESTASLRAEMLALTGVDLMENSTTFKSTYNFLEELSAKWKDLTDIQRAKCLPDYIEIYN